MTVTKLSTKGQVVLPKEIRETLGISSGTEFEVEVRDGVLLLRPIRKTTVDDLLGILPWAGDAVSIEEMDAAIAEGAKEQG